MSKLKASNYLELKPILHMRLARALCDGWRQMVAFKSRSIREGYLYYLSLCSYTRKLSIVKCLYRQEKKKGMIRKRNLLCALNCAHKNPLLVGYKGAQTYSSHQIGSKLDGRCHTAKIWPFSGLEHWHFTTPNSSQMFTDLQKKSPRCSEILILNLTLLYCGKLIQALPADL